MFPLRYPPMPHRKWGQVRDGGYSCRTSPLREPMPSDPSRTDGLDEDGMDEEVSAGGAGVGDSTAGGSSLVSSSPTLSRNVADGTKNKHPVTARLKSSIRS